jgi:hypothetical protein
MSTRLIISLILAAFSLLACGSGGGQTKDPLLFAKDDLLALLDEIKKPTCFERP